MRRAVTRRNRDLHGSAPDSCRLALLLVDVINDLDFPEADAFLETALPAARAIARLAARCRRLGVPVVYANDNFGRWRSDLRAVVQHCLRSDVRGRPIARLLRPRRKDYLVLKPKHSAFFASPLETLLRYLEVERVILAGFAGNICVLFTANDLYMRDYELFVPRDCCASNDTASNAFALAQMAKVLKADVRASMELDLERMRGPRRRGRSRA
jgi:nicotinamidase-related amidase